MNALVECVPNFSEGRRKDVIDSIANAISSTHGCHLLDVDPGASTNRTVYTFVGEPEHVIQGALAAARVAHKLIDMQQQKGEHPRVGAMDVCPFIPIQNITIEECVEISKKFAQLLSDELDVPVYLYGESQPLKHRQELSQIRQGEYEKLEERIKCAEMKPDFGPCEFRPCYGASCVGARNFLVAYNINVLGTKEQAHRIALNVREQGRSDKEPGRCKKVKAIGWWLDEANMAQISMNLVDFKTTNIHEAYEECCKDAQEMKVALCGSQIVGLIPLESILNAAEYFIKKEGLLILEETQKVKLVIERLGLNSLSPFNPKERIIEYLIQDRLEKNTNKYQNMSLRGFVDSVAARTSIPGGGCVAALVASIGSSLGCMGGLLTYGNRKYEKYDAQIREILPNLYDGYQELLQLVDQDANAFNSYLDARRLPDKTEKEKLKRVEASAKALFRCVEVPFTVAVKAHSLWPHMKKLAPIFNMDTKSDLLVAIRCLETGIYGAYANVLINAKSYNGSDEKVTSLSARADEINTESKTIADELVKLIESRS